MNQYELRIILFYIIIVRYHQHHFILGNNIFLVRYVFALISQTSIGEGEGDRGREQMA